jgi:hypothetical protein
VLLIIPTISVVFLGFQVFERLVLKQLLALDHPLTMPELRIDHLVLEHTAVNYNDRLTG